MERIVIIGASGHGKVVADILKSQGKTIVGFIDSSKIVGSTILSLPVLGKEENLTELIPQYAITHVIVAIGDNWVRSQVVNRVKKYPLLLATAISPSALISSEVSIGDGSVICAGVTVGPGSTIGRCCLINTHASLDHDGIMGNFSSLAPGVITGGNVKIGAYSAICLGARIIHRIAIDDYTVIGAGSLVLHNVENHVVAYGVPAKVIRRRQETEKYL